MPPSGPGAAYGPAELARDLAVSRETLARLEAYAVLLQRWQQRINLVAPSTVPDLWRRHFLDSAQLSAHAPPGTGSLIDLGSGAGFPGLVLAILGCAERVHLIEADQRKSVFLAEAIRITAAPAVVHAHRIEDVDLPPAGLIVSRACAPLEKLLTYAARFWGPGTMGLFLKGKGVKEELTATRGKWTMHVEEIASRSDPAGCIIQVRALSHGRNP